MNHEKAFVKFFGISTNDLCCDKAIITNITTIFSKLIESVNVISKHRGFYDLYKCELSDGTQIYITKIAQGKAIIDVVKLLSLRFNELFFWGIAGSISSSIDVGVVCSPRVFFSCNDNLQNQTNNNNSISILQVDGLIYDDCFYTELVLNGIDLVDMESFDFFKTCSSLELKFKYIVQVSDKPLSYPFYEASFSDINISLFFKESDLC